MEKTTNGNDALELGIALEALLADGTGENTYKISTRAAKLHPGNLESRLKIRHAVSGLYKLRSQVVHDGRVSNEVRISGRGKVRATEIIKEGTNHLR